MAGCDGAASGHPRGPEGLPGRQRHGRVLVVIGRPRVAEGGVLDRRRVDPEQDMHLAAERLGDVGGGGDARPGRVGQVAVLEVRRPDPEYYITTEVLAEAGPGSQDRVRYRQPE